MKLIRTEFRKFAGEEWPRLAKTGTSGGRWDRPAADAYDDDDDSTGHVVCRLSRLISDSCKVTAEHEKVWV